MHVALDGIESRRSVRIEGSGFGAQDSGSMVLSFGAVGLRVFCGCAFDCEAIENFAVPKELALWTLSGISVCRL